MTPSSAPVALVADDHVLFRAGASAMLMRECGFRTVLEAGSLPDAVTLLRDEPAISLACLDLGMPGVSNPLSLKQLRERFPHVRLAVVTGSESRDHILLALQSGVHGYVPKTLAIGEMIRAFQIITAGGIYVPHTISELPASLDEDPGSEPSRVRADASEGPDHPADVALTKRQNDVLRLIRSGRSNKEIGWRLGLSENTVKVHTNALYKKLRVHSRFQAAASADPATADAATNVSPKHGYVQPAALSSNAHSRSGDGKA